MPSERDPGTLRAFAARSWVRDAASILSLTAVIVSVYFPIILGHKSVMTDTSVWPTGELFVGDPAAGGQITYYKELAVAHAWSHLHLPLWLPTEGYGITLAGNQAAPWFIPEVILHLIFPTNFSMWNVVAVLIATIGAYLLARHLEIGRLGAIAASLVYGLSGPIVANLNLDMINPIALTPYVIIASMRLVETDGDRRRLIMWWAATALAISQLFLSGFAEVLPLELILVGLVVLVRSAYVAPTKALYLRRLGRWLGAVVLGIAGSLIASVSLVLPLSTYTLFQPAGAELAAEPKYWMLTLIDPWAFGKTLAGGPFDAGHTVWVPGSPIVVFLGLVAVLALWQSPRGWSRAWRIAMVCLIAFGLLGFANLLGVLNVMRVPPLNLIYSPRFLPFLWWLPVALMVGAGVDELGRLSRSRTLGALLLAVVAMSLFIGDIVAKGPAVFPIISSRYLGITASSNVPVLAMFAIVAVFVVVSPQQYRRFIGLLGVGAMVLLIVPRNFFPITQAPEQASSVVRIIRNAGLGQGLSFSPGDYTVPSGLIGSGIASIQAFDVFFPKGYSTTISHYFGEANSMTTQSPLYPAAPSMINVPVNGSTIPSLKRVGVETMVLPYQLNAHSLTSVTILPEPSGIAIAPSTYRSALNALLSLYLSRPDLITALPMPASRWSLVQWPLLAVKVYDAGALSLQQYFPVYGALLGYGDKHPSSSLFRLSTFPNIQTVGVQFLGIGHYLTSKEYVYSIGGPENASPVVGATSVRALPDGSTAPVPLDGSIAYVPTAVARSVADTRGLRVRTSAFRENASGVRFTLTANHRGLVFLRRQIAPGERVYVDGRQVSLIAVNNFVTGFVARGGIQTVVISYESPLLFILFWTGVLANVLLILVIGVFLSRLPMRLLVARHGN